MRLKFRMIHSQPPQLDLHGTRGGTPKYERIKDHIVGELRSGQLRPGDALPTEVELATQLKVARNTVRQALSRLDREGLINRIRGKGTFVRGDAQQRLSQGIGLMALIMPESYTGHYPSVQHGFEHTTAEEHSQVIVSTTDNDPIRQGNAILQLMSKDVAGVAIVPTIAPAPTFQIEMLQNQGIPVVFCHRRVAGARAPLVAIPFREVGRMAGRALLGQGHRRVAMYMTTMAYHTLPSQGTSATPSAMDYVTGLREVLRQGGGDLTDDMILSGDSYSLDLAVHEKEAWPKIKELFSRPDRPTAIMASYDTLGEIIYMAIQRLGLRVPEDVSVISFGGKQRRGAIVRRMTSVVIDGEDIGRRAARLLDEIAKGQRSIHNTEDIMMPLGLSDGQSLGRCLQPSQS